jgi:glycosyltransferase involved in cell wall biosynthesis
LYADTKRPFELSGLPGNVTVRYLAWRTPVSSVYNDLFMWRRMQRDCLDVAHFPGNYGFGPPETRTLITLHDALNLLPMRQMLASVRRDPRTVAMVAYLGYCTRLAVRRAHLLMTDSVHAQREIARRSGLSEDRIVPVHQAPAPDFRRIEDPAVLARVTARHGLRRPYVLADALKNPAVLIKAWQRLPEDLRNSHTIVFFCRHPNPLPVVREAVSAGLAQLLVRPPRQDLIALYSMAKAFVFPSWIEGFGFPLLEAMRCGAPVIASDRGSIPEVAGDAALFADAEDASKFAEHLERVLSDRSEARRLQARGLARAGEFSWRRTAEQILATYHRALEAPPVPSPSAHGG